MHQGHPNHQVFGRRPDAQQHAVHWCRCMVRGMAWHEPSSCAALTFSLVTCPCSTQCGHYEDDSDFFRGVCKRGQALIEAGEATPSDIALLLRAVATLQHYAPELCFAATKALVTGVCLCARLWGWWLWGTACHGHVIV